jgi:hypothetical protein
MLFDEAKDYATKGATEKQELADASQDVLDDASDLLTPRMADLLLIDSAPGYTGLPATDTSLTGFDSQNYILRSTGNLDKELTGGGTTTIKTIAPTADVDAELLGFIWLDFDGWVDGAGGTSGYDGAQDDIEAVSGIYDVEAVGTTDPQVDPARVTRAEASDDALADEAETLAAARESDEATSDADHAEESNIADLLFMTSAMTDATGALTGYADSVDDWSDTTKPAEKSFVSTLYSAASTFTDEVNRLTGLFLDSIDQISNGDTINAPTFFDSGSSDKYTDAFFAKYGSSNNNCSDCGETSKHASAPLSMKSVLDKIHVKLAAADDPELTEDANTVEKYKLPIIEDGDYPEFDEDLFWDVVYMFDPVAMISFNEYDGTVVRGDPWGWLTKSTIKPKDGDYVFTFDRKLTEVEAAKLFVEKITGSMTFGAEYREYVTYYTDPENQSDAMGNYMSWWISETGQAAAVGAYVSLSSMSIVSEGADVVLTLHELSQGHTEAAIGLIPFISSQGGRAIIRHGDEVFEVSSRLGRLVDTLTPDELLAELQSLKALRRNMTNTGISIAPNHHVHHIVAKGCNYKSASKARNILTDFGISTENVANGAILSASAHRGLHTHAYYDKVWGLLNNCSTREQVIEVLDDIATQLRAGTF